MKIYLDDVRTPIDPSWVLVKNYDEFVSTVMEYGLNNISVISLDHDLGDSAMKEYFNNVVTNYTIDYNNIHEKTGYDCAKFLVNESMDRNIPLPLIYTHSANPVGSANIMGFINNYLKNCRLPQTCVRVRIDFTHEQ